MECVINEKKETFIWNIEKSLKEEAEQYCNISRDYRRAIWLRQQEENYFIHRKWFKKWKKYVDYNFIKKTSQNIYFHRGEFSTKNYDPRPYFFPGEIDNSFLLLPLQSFLNDGDMNDPENLVIRQDAILRKEVKIVNFIIWQFFHTKYGGGPEIVKGTTEEKNSHSSFSKKSLEAFYKQVNLVSFPKRIDLSQESLNIIKDYTVFISKAKSLKDLKMKYIRLIKKNGDTIYSGELDPKNLRLWKIHKKLLPTKGLGAEMVRKIISGMLNESLNDKVLKEIRVTKFIIWSTFQI
jgi:hypothetical protein